MRYITLMSLSNATGITALFVVDLLDLFFLSLLGEKYLAAAVGTLISNAIGERQTEGKSVYDQLINAVSYIHQYDCPGRLDLYS